MFSSKRPYDLEQIDRMLQERLRAQGIDPAVLEQTVGDSSLRQLMCELIEQTLRQNEADNQAHLRARQQAGRARAVAQGVKIGRPTKRSDRRFSKLRALYEAHEVSAEEAAQRLHISVSTFYRWLREAREADPTSQD